MKSNKSQKGGELKDYVWNINEDRTELQIVEKKFLIKRLGRNVNNKDLKIIKLNYDLEHENIIKQLKYLLYIEKRIKYNIKFNRIEKGTIIYNINPIIQSITNIYSEQNLSNNMPQTNNGPIQMNNLNNTLKSL